MKRLNKIQIGVWIIPEPIEGSTYRYGKQGWKCCKNKHEKKEKVPVK